MKTRLFLLLIVPLFALLLMTRLPAENVTVVSPDGSGDSASSGAGDSKGATIMSAEQASELQSKIDQYMKQQEKILERIGQMEKDMEFVKSAARTRGRVVPGP